MFFSKFKPLENLENVQGLRRDSGGGLYRDFHVPRKCVSFSIKGG